jgi:hypothetical protein
LIPQVAVLALRIIWRPYPREPSDELDLLEPRERLISAIGSEPTPLAHEDILVQAGKVGKRPASPGCSNHNRHRPSRGLRRGNE